MTGAIRGRKRTLAAAAAAIGASGLLVPALAKDAPAPRLVLTFGSKLAHHSNYDLATSARPATTLDSDIGLTYTTETRLSRLSFSVGGLLRASSDKALTGTGLRQPHAAFSLHRATKDAAFSLGGSYRRERSSDSTSYYTLPDGSISPVPLVTSGTVATTTASARFETGLRAPVGFALSGNVMNRIYSGAVGTGAYDSRTRRATAMLKLRPDQAVEYQLGLNYSRESDDNILQTRRRDTGAFVGLQRQTAGMTLNAQLGYQRSVTDQIAPYGRQASKGIYGSMGLTRKVPTGTVSVTLDAARDSVGLRNTLSLGTVTTTRSGDKLSAKLGLAARPGGTPQLVGQLAYGGKLPDATYSLGLNRSVALNADNVDVAYTRLTAGYTRKINALSSLGLDLSMSRTSGADYGSYATTTRQSLALSYNHDLTADWQLSAGVKHLHQTSSTGPATDNSAFLSIKRNFTLLP